MSECARRGRRSMVVVLTVALGLMGCGSGEADPAEADPAEADPAEAGVVEVTGVDYAFEGVPASVTVGTRFTFTNAAAEELHELVIAPLAPGDDRSIDELLALGPALQGELAGPPSVIIAMPGQPGAVVDEEGLGDGTVTAPGRYLLLCMIPQGIDPADYIGPEGQYDGVPHAALGMVAEVTGTE